jgi:Na+-driven multidrug efflux pump
MGIVSLVLIIFPSAFIGLFVNGTEVLQNGSISLQVISFGFVFYGLGMVMVQALNGAGDTFTPTWINFLCFWLLEIPLAYAIALYLDYGETGVYIAIVISESVMALAATWIFSKGRWKKSQV